MSDEPKMLEARLGETSCNYGKFLLCHMGTFLLGWLVGSHLLEQVVRGFVGIGG